MWSDNESNTDLLGYQHLVGAVQSVLTKDHLLPATIGVFGDWGSGKSTLIQMVRADLEKDQETLVLSFNGWLFEGYEDAKLALMGTIIDELADRKKLTVRGKELVLGLVRRINGWRITMAGARVAAAYAVGDIAGMTIAGATTDFNGFLEKAKDVDPGQLGQFLRENDPGQQLRRGVREFRADFTELLDDTKVKRLVVVVDDLDRCTPDTIIETLEAIKLFLFVPRTAFVIGADERLIEYAVRRRFPELPGERAEVGRDYLEKLIQFPVRIPAMGRGETETYVKLLLADHCVPDRDAYERLRACGVVADASIDASLDRPSVEAALGTKLGKDLDEALALADRVSPVLAAGLAGNPRQCKRFLNTLFMRLGMAESRSIELKRRTLAKLMLLEYLKPESFKELARLQATQAGRPAELAALERSATEEIPEEPKRDAKETDGETARGTGANAKRASNGTRDDEPVAGATGVLSSWMSDPWLSDWLAADPRLADEDLRPYFYFSRDTLDSLLGAALRMSPEAQDCLARLLASSVAERSLAIKRAGKLSPADAASVFEALARRVRETESLSGTDGPLIRMFEWVDVRKDLFSEFATFLKSLPESTVPFAVTARLAKMASTPTVKTQVIQVLEHWAGSTNERLKKAAAAQLTQVSK